MSFDKIGELAIKIVLVAAFMGNLDRFNHWVQVATAKVLWESRASAWGSPRFWPENEIKHQKQDKNNNQTRR